MSEEKQLAMHESRNRATSAAVIWHIVSFGQKYTERPNGRAASHCFERARMLYFGQEEISSLHHEEHREVWSVSGVMRTFCESKTCVGHQAIR
jgi:mannose-6-phosphate isomerase-like protein (cupin superfamily)